MSPWRILQVIPQLGIGGVETHVDRLARGLLDRGHRVVLLATEPPRGPIETGSAAAETIAVPFDRGGRERAVNRLAGSAVDIVHAHNYRAARFARPLADALGARYLMTVHGPRHWVKRLLFRDWSDPVLTVSEADRENITGPFGPDPERVAVGFLGVDTDRFRPGLDSGAFRTEWGLDPEEPLVLHISRFSGRKARPALALLDALPLLRKRVPDARLVLVGDGPERERIARRVDAANRSTSRRAALLVGPRHDVPEVLNAADVVVATATTALEAMACARPTIAWGRTGYFGRVTRENFEAARTVCFGDHGPRRSGVEPQRLADELERALVTPVEPDRVADRLREYIRERYSVERMVDQVEGLYRAMMEGAPGGRSGP